MKKAKYIISMNENDFLINGIKISDEVFNQEKTDYRIKERESMINDLIDWISECKNSDKQIMKDDLKILINIKDEFILSSMSVNEYLYGNSKEFNEQCKEILTANELIN